MISPRAPPSFLEVSLNRTMSTGTRMGQSEEELEIEVPLEVEEVFLSMIKKTMKLP